MGDCDDKWITLSETEGWALRPGSYVHASDESVATAIFENRLYGSCYAVDKFEVWDEAVVSISRGKSSYTCDKVIEDFCYKKATQQVSHLGSLMTAYKEVAIQYYGGSAINVRYPLSGWLSQGLNCGVAFRFSDSLRSR